MVIVDFRRLTRIAAPLVAAAFAWPLPAAAETAVHLKLDRKIDGPAAPFFVAIDKGYFKAEGLDVTIDAPAGEPQDTAKLLATTNYDLAVADLNLLIKLRDQSATGAKAVFVVFDKPPAAVIARRSRGLSVPGDLAGKILAAPANEPASARWPIFAKLNGIDTEKVRIENVGLPVRDPMLAAGEVDAITGCAFISYIDLKERGVPKDDLAVWQMADYGVELYGATIIASENFITEKPDAVRGFLRAYVKALKETVRDPASAIEAVLRAQRRQQGYRARTPAHGDRRQHRDAGGANRRIWRGRSGAVCHVARSARADLPLPIKGQGHRQFRYVVFAAGR